MMGSMVGMGAMAAGSSDLRVFALGLGPRCQASATRSSPDSTRQFPPRSAPASDACLAGISERAMSCQSEMQLSTAAISPGDSFDRDAGGSHHLDRQPQNTPASLTGRCAVIGSSKRIVRIATAPAAELGCGRKAGRRDRAMRSTDGPTTGRVESKGKKTQVEGGLVDLAITSPVPKGSKICGVSPQLSQYGKWDIADRMNERSKSKATIGMEAAAGDVLVNICSFIQPKDIGRLSTVSRVLFDERVWQQLHLALYGSPTAGIRRSLPLAHASRIQLQSDFPVHHSRLIAIRHHHWLIRSEDLKAQRKACPARALFVLETLAREDKLLRDEETTLRLDRAESRRKQCTNRAGALRDLSLAKRASTDELMLMVDMRAAVERHAYAPGGRPKSCQAFVSRNRMYTNGGGRAVGFTKASAPSLVGILSNDSQA